MWHIASGNTVMWHSVSGHSECGTVSHKNGSYDLHNFESVKIIIIFFRMKTFMETLVTSQPMFVTHLSHFYLFSLRAKWQMANASLICRPGVTRKMIMDIGV